MIDIQQPSQNTVDTNSDQQASEVDTLTVKQPNRVDTLTVKWQLASKRVTRWTGTQKKRVKVHAAATLSAMFPPTKPRKRRSKVSRALSFLMSITLWSAFAAFLFASLPHVAYFFASMEPEVWSTTSQSYQVDGYWWTISYLLAGSIDITAFLLSLNVSIKMRQACEGLPWHKKFLPALGVSLKHWPFILILVAFSWLVNFEHAKQFGSDMLNIAEQVQINLLFWQGNLATLNPIIGSAFPVLAVAYTTMADSVADDRNETDTKPSQTPAEPAEPQPTLAEIIRQLDTENGKRMETLQQRFQETMQEALLATIAECQRINFHTIQHLSNVPSYIPRTPNTLQLDRELDTNGQVSRQDSGELDTLSTAEKKEQTFLLLLENQNLSGRAIGEMVGVSHTTGNAWKSEMMPKVRARLALAYTEKVEVPA